MKRTRGSVFACLCIQSEQVHVRVESKGRSDLSGVKEEAAAPLLTQKQCRHVNSVECMMRSSSHVHSGWRKQWSLTVDDCGMADSA